MSPDDVRALFEARQNDVAKLRELDEAATGREFSGEERAQYDALNAAISEKDERIKAGLRMIEDEKRAQEALAGLPVTKPGKAEQDDAEKRAAKFWREARSIEVSAPANQARAHEFRDLLAGTATDGLELVPTTLYGQLIESLTDTSQIMAAGPTVLRTTGGDAITIPKVTSYSAMTLIAEAAAIPESDPQFGTVTLNAYKGGFAVQASTELIQDAAFDVPGFLARQGSDRLGVGMDTYLTTGTGTNQPEGVVNATTGVTLAGPAASATVTTDELIEIAYSVARPYRAGASWLMADSSVKEIRKLKDADGNYIWQPGITAGAPDTLLGRPVYVSTDMQGFGGTSRTVIVFGDFGRGLFVRFAGPIRIERSDDYAFLNDLVTWRFLVRFDSGIVDNNALRKAVTAAT